MLFSLVSMGGMLAYADQKAITISNVAQDQVMEEIDFTGGEEGQTGEEVSFLRFREGEKDTAYLCIPLEKEITAKDVIMENHYMERQMWIYIKGSSVDYYKKEAVSGDISNIEAGTFEALSEFVLLKFSLTDVFEYKSVMEENYLYIEFVPPREVYDKIVVIDAGCGGDDAGCRINDIVEKDITLDIVKRLKKLLEKTDIKVYYTRTEDVDYSSESRVALANAVGADMFIGVRLNTNEDTTVYGTDTLYNENYFIPGFGSVELADMVERNVVTGISGKGNGLYAAEGTDVLIQEAKVPVAVIRVGYASNKQEARLLLKEDYRDRIAEGLYQAILEAFE